MRQVSGFFPGTIVSSINKTDRHDVTEILLKVALNTTTLTLKCHEHLILIKKAFMEAKMCFEFYHGLADISILKFTNICQPMLKLKTHSGFLELF